MSSATATAPRALAPRRAIATNGLRAAPFFRSGRATARMMTS